MKHHWRLGRSSVATPDAQQRWDRAYQSLLLWSQRANQDAPSTRKTLETLPVQDVLDTQNVPVQQDEQEVTHAGTGVCTCLDAESSPGADH